MLILKKKTSTLGSALNKILTWIQDHVDQIFFFLFGEGHWFLFPHPPIKKKWKLPDYFIFSDLSQLVD